MPRTLKRRSDAISRDAPSEPDETESSSSDHAPPARAHPPPQSQHRSRRQQQSPNPSPNDSPGPNANDTNSDPEDSPDPDRPTPLKPLIKKLVRLALSTDHARLPLRRNEIAAKILRPSDGGAGAAGAGSGRANFRAVFLGAQTVLREVFGMEMVELPGRERVGLAERRKGVAGGTQTQTQTQTQGASRNRSQMQVQTQMQGEDGGGGETQKGRGRDAVVSAQSWVLVSVLPEAYRVRAELLVPGRAPDEATDSAYTAMYSLVVGLLYLHTPSGGGGGGPKETQGEDDGTEPLSDAKLHRYLKRVNLDSFAPLGNERSGGMPIEKLLARMQREGYIEKRRDLSGGEEMVEWVVGPRGKKEIGRKGVAGLVRGVYGFGVDGSGKGLEVEGGVEGGVDGDGDDNGAEGGARTVKMERDELERRLKRTLGEGVAITIPAIVTSDIADEDGEGDQQPPKDGRSRNRANTSTAQPRRSGRRGRAGGDNNDEDEE